MRFPQITKQFILYVASGLGAVAFDFGSYFLLLKFGVWYVAANVVGNILGFFSAFVFHKYIAFQKHGEIAEHFLRYCLVNLGTFLAQTGLLYVFVESLHMGEGDAKFLSWAVTILANFFLYKFLVYV